MSSSQIEAGIATATSVAVTDETLVAHLADGRVITVPLNWYPRLQHATANERSHWELQVEGRHVHWPEIDEDLSIEDLLIGRPSAESDSSLNKWLAARRNGTSLTLEARRQ